MAEDKKRKDGFWNFADSFEGDRVVWMIVLLLMMISIVAIFSSTSQLALQQGTSRMAIIREQLLITALGLCLIILCYNIRRIGIFRVLSQLGFLISIALLAILASHKTIGPFKPLMINQAWRVIAVSGFQIHVYEVVKVAMIMYLAWAVNAYRNDSFMIANLLAKKYPFWGKDGVKQIVYIYLPIFLVCLGMMFGSLSSTLFIGSVMFITILVGGISMRKLALPILLAVVVLGICIGINEIQIKNGHEPTFTHLQSALNRVLSEGNEHYLSIIKENASGSEDFQKALDKIKQPYSAKIAVHEGGIIGKGPGRSTQRYVVPIMFEDYMFSFIVEEYGLLGGIIVLILYGSLLARGAIIVRNCDNHFAKVAVAGLVILITGQAMMHILINVDMGPLTGQTLPMISHGNSSFLMFSIAFGIILSISRMAKRKIAREVAKAAPLVEHGKDEVRSSLNDLDLLESGHEDEIPDLEISDYHYE